MGGPSSETPYGIVPLTGGFEFENACKNVRFKLGKEPERPETEDALVGLVERARSMQRKLKVIGGSHSFNHISKTSGTLIDLRDLNRTGSEKKYPLIHLDRDRNTADLEAGATLGEAITALDREGLHFSSLGSYHGQTIAGAIATSTHGSSLRHGSLSDAVLEVRALLADGTFRTFKDGDELRAMRAHLGQLGIVTRVKVRVEPRFWLGCSVWTVGERDGFASIVELAREHEYVSMLWLPYTREACIRVLERVGVEGRNRAAIRLERNYTRGLVQKTARNGGFWLVQHFYLLRPKWLGYPYTLFFRKEYKEYSGVVDKSYKVFLYEQYRVPNDNGYLRMILNAEYALDVNRLRSALDELSSTINENRKHGRCLNYPRLHIRFAQASDRTLVGLNAGRDTAYVGIYINASIRYASQIAIAKAIEHVLIRCGGRPHWGKYRYVGPGEPVFDDYERTYPGLPPFTQIRGKLDPGEMFSDGSTSAMFAGIDPPAKTPGGLIASLLHPRAYGRIPPPD
jgi:FAD/FMN-containing dehydrogenase